MGLASSLGFELFFLLLPFLTWNGKRNFQIIGYNLLMLMNFMLLLQAVAKIYFLEERPIWIDKTIEKGSTTGFMEFSFPSGHAWATTVAWLFLAHHVQKGWMFVLACGVIGITSFSRVYFGVHYPHDVVAGIVAGSICFIFRRFFFMFPLHAEEGKRRTVLGYEPLGLGQFFLWFCFLGITFVLEHEHKKQQLGLFYSLGSIITLLFLRHKVPHTEDDSTPRFIARIVIGLVPIMALVYGIFLAYKTYHEWIGVVMFVSGTIMATWHSVGAPFFFTKVGLTTHTQKTLKKSL
jgi:hypothetical protein